MRTAHWLRLAFLISATACFHWNLLAADPTPKSVPMFEALDAGQIDVEFIPADEKMANVLVTNRTNQVLHVELPAAIAAVPVLAQFDQGLGQNQNPGGGGGASQAVGGAVGNGNQGFGNAGFGNAGFGNAGFGNAGFGNAGFGNAGFGNPGPAAGGNRGGANQGFGMMRIAPGKTRKLVARTVCFEYGKTLPRPRMNYRMIPITQYTGDVQLIELCQQLGNEDFSQSVAQAIAWHLASELSWKSLAEINRVESRYLGSIKFFDQDKLREAKTWVVETARSETREETTAGEEQISAVSRQR